MNRKLEQYVEEVNTRLSALPDVAREQEVAELRQHLDALVAANLELGESEETATRTAIHQFGAARKLGSDLNLTGWRLKLKTLPEHVVTGLYSLAVVGIFSLVIKAGISPLLSALLPPRHLPANALMPWPWVTSLLLGLLALYALVVRDGRRNVICNVLSRDTAAGAGARWVVLYQSPVSLGFAVAVWQGSSLPFALIPAFLWSSVGPFVAGLLVGWKAPVHAAPGVGIAAMTLAFANSLSAIPSALQSASTNPNYVVLAAILLIGTCVGIPTAGGVGLLGALAAHKRLGVIPQGWQTRFVLRDRV